MKDWNSVYESKGEFQVAPSPSVIAAINSFETLGFRRVLDLGCGTGRHTTCLVDAGFEVFGCDCSAEALGIAREVMPQVCFEECDMTLLPYDDGYFDAIICNHVIQHGTMADIERAVGEIRRTLRTGGRLLLIVVSTRHPKSLTGREIEPNTKVDTDALDGHVPHHFFTEDELRGLLEGFEIIELSHFEGPSELDPTTPSAAWEVHAQRCQPVEREPQT